MKREVARSEPEWRLAFSRPAFVTFKVAGDCAIDDVQLSSRQWVLARSHGISLGRLVGTELQTLAKQVWELEGVAALFGERGPADVHVWERESNGADDEESGDASETPLAREVEDAIRLAAPVPLSNRRRPTRRNGRVLDVVLVAPNEWCVGYHKAVTPADRWPGGAIPVAMPEHAVSRAYAKMEEAIAWSGLPLAAGDECVEIGCAPGGSCQALLDRGLFVTGIDPADVDPAVVAHPRFRHLKKRGREVKHSEFAGVRWLAADVNLAPQYVLDTVEAIVKDPGVSIRGMILTLKFGDWSEAHRLPEFASRVHGWGYRDVRTRQLATGGQEVCLVALRRKELRKLNRKRKLTGASGPKRKRRRVDAPHSSPNRPHF